MKLATLGIHADHLDCGALSIRKGLRTAQVTKPALAKAIREVVFGKVPREKAVEALFESGGDE